MAKAKPDGPPKDARGGPRPKSGRPRAALTKARDDWDSKLSDLIAPDVPRIVDSLKRLAMGVHQEKVIDDEKVIVYQMPPDFKAASYLLDRLAGKPRQAVTVDSGKVDIGVAVDLTNQAAIEYREPDDPE